jgi:hypothetical protein
MSRFPSKKLTENSMWSLDPKVVEIVELLKGDATQDTFSGFLEHVTQKKKDEHKVCNRAKNPRRPCTIKRYPLRELERFENEITLLK